MPKQHGLGPKIREIMRGNMHMQIINYITTSYYMRRTGNVRQKQGRMPAELGIDTKMKKKYHFGHVSTNDWACRIAQEAVVRT